MGAYTVTIPTGLTSALGGAAKSVIGNLRRVVGTITMSASYATGGDTIPTSVLDDFGFNNLDYLHLPPAGGYSFFWDRATNKIKAYSPVTTPTRIGTINDNDNASTQGGAVYAVPKTIAGVIPTEFKVSLQDLEIVDNAGGSTGVDVYVAVDDPSFHPDYALGHLEFVSPTDVDGTGTIDSGGATYHIRDSDDAATGNVIVRAVAAGAGLEATTAASKDIMVPLSDGTFIHINHGTTASTPDLVFDEDASNTYERLLTETVDSAAEVAKTWVTLTTDAGASAALNLWMVKDDEYMLVHADTGPLTYAVGSGGPTCVIEGRPDAASLPGAVVVGAIAAGAGLDAALPSGRNGFVALSNGEYIQITYAASPTGVALYANPEAASTDLTLECVVVDSADETFTIATTRTQAVNAGLTGTEVVSGTDLSGATIEFVATGK